MSIYIDRPIGNYLNNNVIISNIYTQRIIYFFNRLLRPMCKLGKQCKQLCHLESLILTARVTVLHAYGYDYNLIITVLTIWSHRFDPRLSSSLRRTNKAHSHLQSLLYKLWIMPSCLHVGLSSSTSHPPPVCASCIQETTPVVRTSQGRSQDGFLSGGGGLISAEVWKRKNRFRQQRALFRFSQI